jgi:DNA-binding NarL/FixJ family response regulator
MSPVRTRVLIVEDDDDLRSLLRTMLSSTGAFDVVGEASDGESALRVASACRPDVVILHFGLPDLAGKEVLTRLREAVPQVDVVVYAADESAKSEVVSLGAAGFVSKAEDLGHLVDVLHELERQTPPWAVLGLAVDDSSPRSAREFLVRHLSAWECDHVIDDASLVVSELVANAVTHAASESELRIRLRQGVLRIEVSDAGPGTPDPRTPSAGRGGGRGLQIVSALARAWGVSPTPAGKTVWAELAA